MRSDDRDLEDQMVAYLRRAGVIRGRGTLGDAITSAGLESSYLRKMTPASVGIGNFRRIAEGFGMDAAEAIRYAMDTGGVRRFVEDGARLAPKPKDLPKALKDTVHRMRAKWQEDASDVDLEAIDAQRYEDPHAALSAIEAALEVVSGPRTYARALGIWGSAQAGVYRLDYATIAIGLAIEASQAACDRELLAIQLQRAAYLLKNRGALDRALELSKAMLELRASTDDFDAMGRAFIVHGSLLRSSGDFVRSLRSCRAGMRLLDDDTVSWRFHALHLQSVAHLSKGDLSRAEELAARACQLENLSRHELSRLTWSRARIARKRGDLDKAAQLFGRALTLLDREPVDVALAGAELVRTHLEAGDATLANRAATLLSSIADRVSEHPLDFDHLISAAVLDLALAGIEARATSALVVSVLQAIERGQATAAARLRDNLRL